MEYAKPLPAEGKLSVVYGKHSAECRVSLPVGTTKTSSAEELASHGWLTIGNLAADGIALQVPHSLTKACEGHLLMLTPFLMSLSSACVKRLSLW